MRPFREVSWDILQKVQMLKLFCSDSSFARRLAQFNPMQLMRFTIRWPLARARMDAGEKAMMEFRGKAGLVTGGGSGIGRATAIGFAKLGGAIAIADINGENANKVAAEIAGAGRKAIAILCDVTRP